MKHVHKHNKEGKCACGHELEDNVDSKKKGVEDEEKEYD